MNKHLDDYILSQLRKGKEVNIKLKSVIRQRAGFGIEEIDWLIDGKFILEDIFFFP